MTRPVIVLVVVVMVVFGLFGAVGHRTGGAAVDHGLIRVQLDVVVVLELQVLGVLRAIPAVVAKRSIQSVYSTAPIGVTREQESTWRCFVFTWECYKSVT